MPAADRSHLPWLLSVCMLLSPVSAFAGDLGFFCENNGLTRSVEVVTTDPGFACRVKYSKSSTTTYPWNARADANYCAPRALSLVEKLKSWGWRCDSGEDVRSVLHAHFERYHRYIKILSNVGKTCHFYPAEAQFGNLCGDSREEGVVVYSCDTGADQWDQHLAVFIEIEAEPLIFEVGSSTTRQVTGYHFDQRHLLLETLPSTDADAGAGSAVIECRAGNTSAWELVERPQP